MRSFKFSTYIPPRELWPNARVHWAAKAREVATHRMMARGQCSALYSMRSKPWKLESATVQVTFYFKDLRRRDSDNALAAMKATFDGMVDSGLLKDDNRLTHLPVIMKLDRKNPRVEVEVTG